MAVWERQTQKQRHKGPSFSSSLLDAIYFSIDETRVANDHHGRKKPPQVEEDIEGLRRAIMIEKWIENNTTTPRHFPSNSASSTDSSIFSSESPASRSSPKSKPHPRPINLETGPKRDHYNKKVDGKLARTKTKIYGELKKVKEPISPGGKISNFLNSIFSPRNLKPNHGPDEWGPMRKSRSLKDTTKPPLASSRSCLSKNASSGGDKSKRTVRFCPVSVVFDQDCQQKRIYDDEYAIGSQFIKKNIDSVRLYEVERTRKHELRDCCLNENDFDDMSCSSSDLFELDHIGRVGYEEEELPVYGSTSFQM